MYLVHYYFPNLRAATWSTYSLAQILSRRNNVTILAPNINFKSGLRDLVLELYRSQNDAAEKKSPNFLIPLNIAFIVAPIFQFLSGLELAKKCDVILCQYHPHHFTALIGLLLGKIFRKPVVVRANDIYREMGVEDKTLHQKLNRYRKLIINTFNESFIRFADAFLVTCRENKEILESRKGHLENVSYSFNGVDPSEFSSLNVKDAKKNLNFTEGRTIILFTGRFSGPEYKIDVLLRSFELFREKFVPFFSSCR